MKAPGATAIVRPWGEVWQLWKPEKKRAAWQLNRTAPLSELKLPSARVRCAVPARLVVAVCFWVEAVEEVTVHEMARLEVEMKGLAAGERLTHDVVLRSVIREETRTLVLAKIFPPEWPLELESLRADSYDASPCLAVLADRSVHLWREGDDLVAVVVWRGEVVCWETMHWTVEPGEIEVWLRCFFLQLQSELEITEPLQLKEWVRVFSEVPDGFVRGTALSESDREEGPAVLTTAPAGSWAPAFVRKIRQTERQRGNLVKVVLGFLLAAGLAGLIAAGLHLQVRWELEKIDAELAALETEIAPLRSTARRWTQIESAVDHRFYPLEMLHLVVSSLPPSGVRLTVFEMSPGKVFVEGEAGNVSAATEFFGKIQADPQNGFSWEMPPPRLQPNNTARFVINGGRDDGQ